MAQTNSTRVAVSSAHPQKLAVLRLPSVKERTGLSRSTLYLRIAAGSFPAPISLGGRAVGWLESEVEGWIAGRIAERRTVEPACLDSVGNSNSEHVHA
jgi:prophage regulatory protein